jgi:hypothetical protein
VKWQNCRLELGKNRVPVVLPTISEDLNYPVQLTTLKKLTQKGLQVYTVITDYLNNHLVLASLKTAFKNDC